MSPVPPRRPYDLVIFDFDGTLADSGGWFASVFNGVARRYRFREVDQAELKRMRGQEAGLIMRNLGVPRWKLWFISRHMRALMARDIAQIKLFPGIDRLLVELKGSGLTLALVSSNARANVEAVLGPDLASLFGLYACGASAFGKSAKFDSVRKRTGIAASRTISIGDEVRDIDAAKAAGIDAGAVTWGYAAPQTLRDHRPTVLFETVDEIARFIVHDAEPGSIQDPSV